METKTQLGSFKILLLILSWIKFYPPPEIIRKLQVSRWFQGEMTLTLLNIKSESRRRLLYSFSLSCLWCVARFGAIFVQIKKLEKHRWSVTFSKSNAKSNAPLWVFLRFLNCTNGTNPSHKKITYKDK